MTSRERVLTTLRHADPDRVPIDLGSGTTGIEVEAYDRLKALLGSQSPTRTFVRDHAEVDEGLLQRSGIDTRYVCVGPPRGYRVQIDADNSYVDIWGVRWQKPPSSLYWDMVGMDRLLPGKYYIQFFLGTCHLALEEPATALPFFEKALALDPKEQDVPSIYSYLGLCLKDLGKFREALAAVHKAEALDRERTDVYNLMVLLLLQAQRARKSDRLLQKGPGTQPCIRHRLREHRFNYRDMGDREKALDYYRLALELDPTIDFARENLQKVEGE